MPSASTEARRWWLPRPSRASWLAGTVFAGIVAFALWATLDSLRTHGFDGLNNLLQWPLAIPWVAGLFFLEYPGHEAGAWQMAACGWLNAALIVLYGQNAADSWRRVVA